jgi:hypothetical protein
MDIGAVKMEQERQVVIMLDKPKKSPFVLVFIFLMNCGMRTKQEIEFLPWDDIVIFFLLLFSVYD